MREFYMGLTPEKRACYDLLRAVSRSFAFVIEELPGEIRDSVCCFYLLMRALDTVEDSDIPEGERKRICAEFPDTLEIPEGCLSGIRDTQYRDLIQSLSVVVGVFMTLPPGHKEIIQSCIRVCGEGMVKYISRDIRTTGELDEYCHCVAGVVGNGMGRIFAMVGERRELADPEYQVLSSGNGIFLQRVNIIRDYVEDRKRGRNFWPYPLPESSADAFIEDTLERYLPPSLKNLRTVSSPTIFRCCALPTLMGLATLVECYSNPLLFRDTPVKISQDLTAEIFGRLHTQADLRNWVFRLLGDLDKKLPFPNSEYMSNLIETCHNALVHALPPPRAQNPGSLSGA